MFVLINVWSSPDFAPYIASVDKFDTIEDAKRAMKTMAQKNYDDYFKEWVKNGKNEDMKPYIEEGIATFDIIGYDYHDLWEIKQI